MTKHLLTVSNIMQERSAVKYGEDKSTYSLQTLLINQGVREAIKKKKSQTWDIVPTSADPAPPCRTWDALSLLISIIQLLKQILNMAPNIPF
jgi:hypothetical protein